LREKKDPLTTKFINFIQDKSYLYEYPIYVRPLVFEHKEFIQTLQTHRIFMILYIYRSIFAVKKLSDNI